MPAPFILPPTKGSTGKFAIYEPFNGIDWSMSIHRPGCQDHLRCMSRRGDKLVPHTGPIGMRSNAKGNFIHER